MRTPSLLVLAASIAYDAAAHAQASSSARAEEGQFFNPNVVPFEPYEPSYLGYTRDSDDVGFMDFKISVKYPAFKEYLSKLLPDSQIYFAFTGRWGQYIGDRYSSPVIAKRFNPKLLWRQTLRYACAAPDGNLVLSRDCDQKPDKIVGSYVELALGHESNGQTVSTARQLAEAEDRERDVGDRISFAKDHISRGWDVLEVTAKYPVYGDHHITSLYAIVKYFLPHGPFQGPKEEFDPSWETDPEGKPRSHVNGLGAIAKWQGAWKSDWTLFSHPLFAYPKVAAVFETGYARPFRYNTVRIEGGVRILGLPATIWGQSGYGSDLAQYYKKVKSRGIELEIGSF